MRGMSGIADAMMKAGLLAGVPILAFAQGCMAGERLGACYYKRGDGVEIRYYGGYPRQNEKRIKVEGADGATFRLLADTEEKNCGKGALYGADARNAFFRQKAIHEADVGSFRAHQGGYAVDKKSVFYRGEKIPGASPDGFGTVPVPNVPAFFAVSASGVYFRNEPVKAPVSPESFEALGGRWVRDDKSVYLYNMETPVKGADPATFVPLAASRRDQMNVRYARDKRAVYHIGKGGAVTELPGAAPSSFRLLNSNYGKDTERVYYNGSLVEGAEAASFHIPHPINSHTGYDRHGKYHMGKRVAPK